MTASLAARPAADASQAVPLASCDASPPPEGACVLLRDLSVSYGARPVLRGLDWSLREGQVVGLLGRNGAGKTTLLETLLGLREPLSGEARLFGQPAQALDDAGRARVGYVPQRSDLFDWLTADQLLAYFRGFYPRWNTAKVEGLLSRWDIARDQPVGRLSGGQQQRLSIIRALAHEPSLLVLDEPVASLDPAGRRDFLRELVEQVVDRGTTVVFSTHILSDLERVAFDVAFLQGGRLALQASLDELLETTVRLHGTPEALRRFAAAHRLVPLQGSAGPDPVAATGARGEPATMLARHAWGVARPQGDGEVALTAVTLEELFLEVTR